MIQIFLLLLVTAGLPSVSGWNLVLSPNEERLQNRRSGDNFLVVCKVKDFEGAASDVMIEWYRDEKQIPRFGSTMTIERTYSNQLMINRPKTSDGGKYTCKAVINEESQEISAEISFVDPPRFVDVEENQHPEEGTRAEIVCKVEGTDQLEVFWQFNGITLDETSQRGYEFSDDNQILFIPHFNAKNDDGLYNCNAAQYSSFETFAINVTGHARPTITVFDVPSGSRGIEGHTIELKCGAVGKPKPTYKWFFENDEIPITRSDKHNVDEGLLIIESLNSEDAGSYKCIANNSVGSNERSFDLAVFLKPKVDLKQEYVTKEGDQVEIVCGYHGDVQVTAKFFSGSKEFAVNNKKPYKSEETQNDSKETVTIENTSESGSMEKSVNTVSTETETVDIQNENEEDDNSEIKKWKRFANNLPDERITIEDKDNKLVLTLKNVSLEDAGEYSCVVSNEAGTTTKTTKLGVIHPPTLRHYTGPYIRSFNGNTLSIYCDVSAVPSPKWIWLKNGREVEANGVSIQIDTQDSSTKLTLENYEGSDNFGKYTCRADNGVGQFEKDIEVIQIVKPTAPVGLDCKRMIYPNYGKCSVDVEVYASENSRPKTIEFLIGKLEDSSSDFNWDLAQLISVDYDSDLTVPNLTPNTQYTIKARAVNDAGSSEFSEEVSLETTDPWAPQSPASVKMECSEYCVVSWETPNDHGSSLEKYRILIQEMHYKTKEEEHLETTELSLLDSNEETFTVSQPENESNKNEGDSISVESEDEQHTDLSLEQSAEILPTDSPTSEEKVENNDEMVLFGNPTILEVDAPENHLKLTSIKPHSYYKISVSAINAVGQGEPSEIEHQTDDSPSQYQSGIDNMYIVIGVAIVVAFVLFVVDLGCFITNRCGLISCICLNICGKNSGAKPRDLESGRNGPESNRLLDSSGAR